MLFAYKNVTESASFFTYINVTQSAFFLHIKCPPLRQFQKFNENRLTQSVRLFVYKNITQIVLIFAKCLDFCI